MRHFIIVFFIAFLMGSLLYIFRKELFYVENTKNITTQKIIKKEKKEKKENQSQLMLKLNKDRPEKPEKPIRFMVRSYIREVEVKNGKIVFKINVNGEILSFETKYDSNLHVLFLDSKKYNIPLTFIIQKKNNRFYIEKVK